MMGAEKSSRLETDKSGERAYYLRFCISISRIISKMLVNRQMRNKDRLWHGAFSNIGRIDLLLFGEQLVGSSHRMYLDSMEGGVFCFRIEC